jgi:hypothetical protein
MDEIDERAVALAILTDDALVDISSGHIDNLYSVGNREYYVLTDCEADERAKEYCQEYIDECVLSEIPENLRYYFDSEKFIEDIMQNDGRARQLSSYDGNEEEVYLEHHAEQIRKIVQEYYDMEYEKIPQCVQDEIDNLELFGDYYIYRVN